MRKAKITKSRIQSLSITYGLCPALVQRIKIVVAEFVALYWA